MIDWFIFIFIILIIIFLLKIGFTLIKKYINRHKSYFQRILKAIKIPVKMLFLILFLYVGYLLIQYIIVYGNNSFKVDDYYSSYEKVMDVSDGYVAIGKSAKPKSNGHQTISISLAIITKYDYDGKIKWQDTYCYGFGRTSSFNDIELTSDGNILVTGTDGDYYTSKRYIAVIYNQEGEILSEYVSRDVSFEKLTYEERMIKQDYRSLNALNNDNLLKIDYVGESEEEDIQFSIINIKGELIQNFLSKY